MDIKLEQYRVFYTVAASGSFSEAAKKLYVTQSAISQQIRALENELSVTLFVRGKKGAKLTSHGELLLNYAKRAINEIESAEQLFARMKSLDEGSLRIGAGDTITRHFLLPWLEKFHNSYPGIKIEIVNRVTDETISRLNSGNVDIAFVNLPISNELHNIDTIEIGELHDIFVVGEKYKHLCKKVLNMHDIASLPLVMLEPKSNSRKATDNYFQEHGIILQPEFELGSYDLLFDFAVKNLGIACVIEEFIPENYKNKVVKLETDFKLPSRSVGICTLKNIEPTAAVVKLIEMITE